MPAFVITAKRTLESSCVVHAASKADAMRILRESTSGIEWFNLEECSPPVKPVIKSCEECL